jgi:uncharacterized protein
MTKLPTPTIWQDGDHAYVRLTVRPNSSKTSICIDKNAKIEITLKAKAESGKANAQLIDFLSKTFNLPEEMIVIRHGATSRKKVIVFKGMNANLVIHALGLDQA